MQNPRTAIVTGAASGLGRALAVRLARDGWCLAIVDRNRSGCEETLRLVQAAGGQGLVEELDVTSVEQWHALRERLQQRWPQLDLLVNNAGVAGSGMVGQYPLEDWHWMINTNLHGVYYGCHTMVGWLKANPRGAHILNTASIAGIACAAGSAAYNTAKAGVIALSETLYAELSPARVRVTVLCPGFFQTNLLEQGRFVSDKDRAVGAQLMRSARFTADHVAEAAVRAMKRKQFYVVMGRTAYFYWVLKRLMPARFLRIVAAVFRPDGDHKLAPTVQPPEPRRGLVGHSSPERESQQV